MRKRFAFLLAATLAAALLASPLVAAHPSKGARSGSTIIAMRDYFQT
jgi:hypothetical protein